MTDDAKPGLSLGPAIKDAIQSARGQVAVDDAIARTLLDEANIGRLAHVSHDTQSFDHDGGGFHDGFDDGSLF
jgi:hypothetical protein